MGYVKEPKGVDLVVEPHIVTEEDRKVISEAIAYYKANGKFKRVSKTSKARRNTAKKVRR